MTSSETTKDPRSVQHILTAAPFGKFRMHVIGSARVGADIGDETGQAYGNDSDRARLWEHRGSYYYGTVFFAVAPDGKITADEIYLSKHWQHGDAPRTYAAIMAGAMAEAITAHLAERPALLIEAERARLLDMLREAREDQDKAAEALSIAEAKADGIHALLLDVTMGAAPARIGVPAISSWADSFGVWHVRVSKHAAAPLIAARQALRDQLVPREANLDAHVWKYPVRVPEMDTDDTIVYRERSTDEIG
jgi:hypothetical protein